MPMMPDLALWRRLRPQPGEGTAQAPSLPAGDGPLILLHGGGSAAGVELPGWALVLPAAYAALLRRGRPAIVARIEGGECLLDLRCIPADRDAEVVAAVRACSS